MDDANKKETLTPEEQTAETEALKEFNEEEARTKIADELGIDPEVEGELLDKLVAKEKAQREKLSGAIKQKINWRKRAEGGEDPKDPNKGKPSSDGKNSKKDGEPVDVAKVVEEKLEEQRLKDLELPEDIESEVRDLAKLKGISVREAAKKPYIIAMIEEAKKKDKVSSASPKRGGNGSASIKDIDVSKPLNPANFDFKTKEGREAWSQAKKAREEYNRSQSQKDS